MPERFYGAFTPLSQEQSCGSISFPTMAAPGRSCGCSKALFAPYKERAHFRCELKRERLVQGHLQLAHETSFHIRRQVHRRLVEQVVQLNCLGQRVKHDPAVGATFKVLFQIVA